MSGTPRRTNSAFSADRKRPRLSLAGVRGAATPVVERTTATLRTGTRATTPVLERATATLRTGTRAMGRQFARLTKPLSGARDRRSAQRIAHRPDGTPVSPSPAGPKPRRAPSGGLTGALKARWADAVREGRLAAREKETEVRASYERRVRHDAHLHAEQHRGKLDGPTAQPRVLPPADPPPPKR